MVKDENNNIIENIIGDLEFKRFRLNANILKEKWKEMILKYKINLKNIFQ